METKMGNLWYIRVGESFNSFLEANQAADDFEVLYDRSCIVDKIRTRWYIFARGPKYHEIKEVKKDENRRENI